MSCSAEIIFVSPEVRKVHRHLPYALLYLSSFCEAKGVATRIIDFKDSFSKTSPLQGYKTLSYLDCIVEIIKAEKPGLICLTCYTAEYHSVMRTARGIKSVVNIPIVIGGVHPTLMPQDFLFAGSPVDFVIRGDGETPLFCLWNALHNSDTESLGRIPGLAYFSTPQNRMIEQGCHIEQDLTRLPMPDYRKIDMAYYLRPDIEHVRWLPLAGVSIFTGRGCPYNCEFCAVNFLRSLNKDAGKMRYRALDQVIEEIVFLKQEYHIDGFYVLDDCFMVSPERAREFCRKLKERRLDLVWGCETRANLVKDDGLLPLMKDAGCIQLDFGVESGSPRMLKAMNKQITVDQVRSAFALCRKYGLRTYANILFNAPGETEEDVQLTHSLLRDISPTVVGCGTTVPLLGTSLYDKFVHPRLTPPEYELYNLNVYEEIVDKRFKLARHDLDLVKLVRSLNNKNLDPIDYVYRLPHKIPSERVYWQKVFSSHYRFAYLGVYIRRIFLKPAFCLFDCFRSWARGVKRRWFRFLDQVSQTQAKNRL